MKNNVTIKVISLNNDKYQSSYDMPTLIDSIKNLIEPKLQETIRKSNIKEIETLEIKITFEA